MNLGQLATIETIATPAPWKAEEINRAHADKILTATLRNIAPELIRLLTVVKEISDNSLDHELRPMDAALAELEEKLKAMEPFS